MTNNSKIIYFSNSRNLQKKTSLTSVILVTTLFLILGLGIFWIYITFLKQSETADFEQEENQEQVVEEEEPVEISITKTLEHIQGQYAYIAFNGNYKEENNYPIIIYSHGSTFTVDDNPKNPLMDDLSEYAELFVNNGFILAASNQHGDNWGSKQAIEDTRNLVDFIIQKYPSSGDIYMIGYSMGGLPTMNYALKYPENIKKIALLAPTTYSSIWNTEKAKIIMDIPVKIWHGNKDVNVPYSMSTTFVKKLASLGKEIPLVTLDGKTHWDFGMADMEEILLFFNSEN